MAAIFAYGTLKQHEERGTCWPRKPLSITPAFVRGSLYNLGEYPALVAGDDWVSGECWLIADEDLPITLQVLDEIECYAKQDDDLYERVVIDCYQTADINTPHHRVFTYYYLHPAHLRDTNRIRPNAAGVCAWSA